ncbi:hypothetical protein TNCT_608021 [Trichonephila clavata]|uniref:Uncharacterized protein n=1 Tax=Trichonephila clavata TaxID=2740835 RepID=A0A8X6HP54_TRICU|nr:hypothetical protein TNCT_608021 [Trichonephila clavata]
MSRSMVSLSSSAFREGKGLRDITSRLARERIINHMLHLKKIGKSTNYPASNDIKVPIEVSGKSLENPTPLEITEPKKNEEIHEVKYDLPPVDDKPNSAVPSPTADSDILISYSDDSKVSAVIGSDMNTNFVNQLQNLS